MRKGVLELIIIRDKPYIPKNILDAIMTTMSYSHQKAISFVKRVIVGGIKSEIIFVNGLPHRYRDLDYKYVRRQLQLLNVDENTIDDFFNCNFQYLESVIPSNADFRPAQTFNLAAKQLTNNSCDYETDISWIKKLKPCT